MGMTSDTIADLLTRIRNALKAEHLYVDLEHSKMREAIVKILKQHGFLAHYLVKEEHRKRTMRIFLQYTNDRKPVIRQLKRVSKPSRRVYVPAAKIPYVFGNMGISVLSTSQGVLDGSTARAKNIGGELLCLVW
ncbi:MULTISPECIES: 30S ribosomal protein S8 [Chlamydia]|uniref:Small ribosomal subunit protein uS8 n=1 Tax=Chlamydia psittaci 99DC5 TaxID=1112251 RepID=A0ABP2X6E0_CHLPS|nr:MULTISPECIES: 30S ribosomal protein S8 [Chlamydia]AFS19102.1 ribosomal S8 family protein [Chlamydia psittaci 84/55]AGE74682.1 30S ribosomal protein S8 [Chlamydia psittaci Mat116]EPJ15933.1 ribosomal S8 family protein [Chlamydia psittaci 02DC18]EPJ16986.1 ribosomal S8 family protein [Chlamydia psittaci 02DC22]EPJ20892.1 ribosomal S8 family protein [Chlamydia psittaci 02DC21]EPJ25443.1 ribosomal S8 family protein [Chlamydia psittaci 09DC77]EPJ30440.1 ribosomal S8 family protein [Chlamydia p